MTASDPPLAPAFTLTETLVVLAILALLVGLVSVAAPGAFERAALDQTEARLKADLDAIAQEARRESDFARLTLVNDGARYEARVGERLLFSRALPRRVRLACAGGAVVFDPAGRARAATLHLRSDAHARDFFIDPITGRLGAARGASNSAGRNPRRRAHHRRRRHLVPGRPKRNPLWLGAIVQPLAGPGHRLGFAGRGPGAAPAISTSRGAGAPPLDAHLRGLEPAQPAPGAHALPSQGDLAGAARNYPRPGAFARFGAPALAPAMSLIEMLVGLAILGLMLALALSNLGPWLVAARRTDSEAAFWRAVEPARLTLVELTAGAIDTDTRFSLTATHARFRAVAPDLSPSPLIVDLQVQERRRNNGQAVGQVMLLLSTSARPGPSVLLAGERPLRLRRSPARTLVVEALTDRTWVPLLTAPMPADAPLRCDFDFISRTCR
jgi:prepilin-type N-terminal cleavage/methylation domain-containing protein